MVAVFCINTGWGLYVQLLTSKCSDMIPLGVSLSSLLINFKGTWKCQQCLLKFVGDILWTLVEGGGVGRRGNKPTVKCAMLQWLPCKEVEKATLQVKVFA